MSPSPKPASAWRREAAGRHASVDGRFALEAEGTGHWYVSDTETRDELGLPRTVGPFATLAEARAAAESRRDTAPEASPLAAKARASHQRPSSRVPPSEPTRRPDPPSQPAWLERLATTDPARANRARRQLASLERRGIERAEAIVRADVEGPRPVVAEALLARALGEALGRDVDEALLRGLVDIVNGKDEDRIVGLPGWQVVERPEDPAQTPRRLRIAASDVAPSRKRSPADDAP